MYTEDDKLINLLNHDIKDYIVKLFIHDNTNPEKITKDLETLFKYLREHNISVFTLTIKSAADIMAKNIFGEEDKKFIFDDDQMFILGQIYAWLCVCEKVLKQCSEDHPILFTSESVEQDFREFKKLFEENK